MHTQPPCEVAYATLGDPPAPFPTTMKKASSCSKKASGTHRVTFQQPSASDLSPPPRHSVTMAPRISPPNFSIGNWELAGAAFSPKRARLNALCSYLSTNQRTDRLTAFKFPDDTHMPPVLVHHSRLAWAGGPLGALLEGAFSEHEAGEVALCPQDDPATFGVVRKFLYCEQILLSGRSLKELLDIALSAHRWALADLFQGICEFIRQKDMLSDSDAVRQAVAILRLPDPPERFRNYFCDSLGRVFDELHPFDLFPSIGRGREREACREECKELENGDASDDADNDDEGDTGDTAEAVGSRSDSLPESGDEGMTSGVSDLLLNAPDLWDVILSHTLFSNALHAIRVHARPDHTMFMLDVILQYVEPRVADDKTVTDLLALLEWGHLDMAQLFQTYGDTKPVSLRAMRLLGAVATSPSVPRLETRVAWEVRPYERFDSGDGDGDEEHIYEVRSPGVMFGPCECYLVVSHYSGEDVNICAAVRPRHVTEAEAEDEEDEFLVDAMFPQWDAVQIELSVLDTTCRCALSNQVGYSGKHGVLYHGVRVERLKAKIGAISRHGIDEELWELLAEVHGSRCTVLISAVFRFLPETDQRFR